MLTSPAKLAQVVVANKAALGAPFRNHAQTAASVAKMPEKPFHGGNGGSNPPGDAKFLSTPNSYRDPSLRSGFELVPGGGVEPPRC